METIVAALCHTLVSQASAAMTHFPTAAAGANENPAHQHPATDPAIKLDPTVHIDPAVHVDLVCLFDGLPTWLLATARNPNRIAYHDSAPVSAAWEGSIPVPPALRSSDRGIRRRILSAQSAAATCPPAARPEAVVVVFGRGVRGSVAAMVVRDMGGERVVGRGMGEKGRESVGRMVEVGMGEESVRESGGIAVERERVCGMISGENGGEREEIMEEGGTVGGRGDAMVEDEEECMEREEDEMADIWEEEDDEEEEGEEDDFRVLVGSEEQRRWRDRGEGGGVEGGGGGEKEWLGSASMHFDRDAGTSHAADVAHGVWFRISTRALPEHVARLLGCLPTQPIARAGVAGDARGSTDPHAHPSGKTPDETPEEGGVFDSKGAAGVLNLDVTAAVALAQAELAQPQLQLLQECLVNKDLIMCETAYKEFSSIVDVIAGPREKQRAAALFSAHVRVVPDQPSSRLLSLPSTARIKQRHVIIFGTADIWSCATLSASSAFVRAARHAGALVRVVEHRPCALMGE
ncbi:unnamed protein product [Closterium sp. NIES-64]|nr:unnamed protein product [Closterium sp. NIES-64]